MNLLLCVKLKNNSILSLSLSPHIKANNSFSWDSDIEQVVDMDFLIGFKERFSFKEMYLSNSGDSIASIIKDSVFFK